MATDIERAAETVAPRTCLSGDAACDICTSEVRDGPQDLLDAGWTLIPPATDDLPEGWEWEFDPDIAPQYAITHNGKEVAWLEAAVYRDTPPAPFAPWVADRVTRLLAELGEG